MDVLVRRPRSPASLRAKCLDRALVLLTSALHRGRMFFSSGVRVGNGAEEALAAAFGQLTADMREELLEAATRRLTSRAASTAHQEAAAMVAAAAEVLFGAAFRSVKVCSELQWHKESRYKVLHLLHMTARSLRTLDFSCYSATFFRLEPLLFSERYILARCLRRLCHLRVLRVPNVADDELLATVAACCPALTDIDVAGSFGVTNRGLRSLSGRQPPNAAFQPDVDDRDDHDDDDQEEDASLPGLAQTLLTANFECTSIDVCGLEVILHDFGKLQHLVVDDAIWKALISGMDEEGDTCVDCVLSHGGSQMRTFSMVQDVAALLPNVVALFPRLTHLTLNALPGDAAADCLQDLDALASLTLIDVELGAFVEAIGGVESVGRRIRTLGIDAKSKSISLDVDLVSAFFPNVTALNVSRCSLRRGTRASSSTYSHLSSLKLSDIRPESGSRDVWKQLLVASPALLSLQLTNVVALDEDFRQLLEGGALRQLRWLRVRSGEVGCIRLSEDTAARMVAACPDLQGIGGVCDWNVRDLLGLLKHLLVTGGWKLELDTLQT